MFTARTDIDDGAEAPSSDPQDKTAQKHSPFLPSIQLRRDDPWRPQEWRWQRAQMLLTSQEEPSPERDDEFVEIALQFLQRDGSAPHAPALEYTLSAQQKTAIQGARRIHNCNGTGKWALQVWLQTGDSPESISGETAIPLEEITWYARLFFDVEDRLHNRSFITHHVIGPKIHYGLSVEDVDVIWRFWAYNGGPRVLEALLDDFFEADMPDYRYLFDGTFRNADLPRTRLILQQALRVQLMSAEDVLRMLSAALKDPATTARAKTLDDLVESLAMPEMGCDSASPGDEPGAPTEDLQGISAGEADVVEVA